MKYMVFVFSLLVAVAPVSCGTPQGETYSVQVGSQEPSEGGSASAVPTSSSVGGYTAVDEKLLRLAGAVFMESFSKFGPLNDKYCKVDAAIENLGVHFMEYGTISSDDGNLLDAPVPAIKVIFETICMDRSRGRDLKTFYGVLVGLDEKYEVVRCRQFELNDLTWYRKSDRGGRVSLGKPYSYSTSNQKRCGYVPRSQQ